MTTTNPLPTIAKKRRALLPTWIKVFLWIFAVTSIIAPFGFVWGLLGGSIDLSLYGLETNQPISLIGLSLVLLFAYKGVVSFGLWMGKHWGPDAGKIDAIIGIVACCFSMLVLPFLIEGQGLMIRLELIALIPYFLVMRKIKQPWLDVDLDEKSFLIDEIGENDQD
ncbi:MAG: hypothetical protein AB8F95_03635 [Bacteroidia bacterium]